MPNREDLLIAVDAGHGGWDNGASWNGRLEKDDNLRLARRVRQQLEAQGVRVLMTRDADVYVPLADRAAMANAAGADFFVSLHRNSYIEQTPTSNGVETFIYLTAPWQSTGRAAQMVHNRIVEVGVQRDRGVQRANFYVLRRTIMPALLLEMGFIIDETDNRLFDQYLDEYAAAIAQGILEYFGLEFRPPAPPPPAFDPLVWEAQRALNSRFGLSIPPTGILDDASRKGAVRALQMALNSDFGAGLAVDGILGERTLSAFPNVFPGQQGNVVFVLQAMLQLNGYNPGWLDGIFGAATREAVQRFQRARGLPADGVVRRDTLRALALSAGASYST